MKKIVKNIGVIALIFIGLFALASCGNKTLTMAENFNKAGVALSDKHDFNEIKVADISTTISSQKSNSVIVLVYSNYYNSDAKNVVYLDQLEKQYNEYGKQKYQTEISFSLYFVDNTNLSDDNKDTFFKDSQATNSGIKEKDYAVLVYVDKKLDFNSSLSKWDDTDLSEINSKIFTFQIGDALKALVA